MADCLSLQLDPRSVGRSELAALYWQAFPNSFTRSVMGSLSRAVALVGAQLDSGQALCAMRGSRLVGLAGLRYGRRSFFSPRLSTSVSTAGILRGALACAVLGMVGHGAKLEEMYVEALAVRPGSRRQAVGTTLLNSAFELARAEGLLAVSLDVVDTNTGAGRLYERLGFVPVSRHRYPLVRPLVGVSATIRMVRLLAP